MPNNYTSKYSLNRHSSRTDGTSALDNSTREMYQSFMNGYVGRINDATFKAAIGGVKIGTAKYSRLAQINLKSRVITFSRYAIENVPERGRRYLVVHELAHILEASHSKKFWDLVERYEPNYKQIGKQLDMAFKRNVRDEQLDRSPVQLPNSITGRMERPKLLLSNPLMNGGSQEQLHDFSVPVGENQSTDSVLIIPDEFDCLDFDGEDEVQHGIVSGGSPVLDTISTSA
jgi:hypothetical protein